jgi:hypothetical protein
MLIRSDKVREWWMHGTGWLWLSRALKVLGEASFFICVLTFVYSSPYWLPFFFVALTSFIVSAKLKNRAVVPPSSLPARAGKASALGSTGAGEYVTPLPPRPMFDREGRTPLERVFTQDEEAEEGAGARRRVGK